MQKQHVAMLTGVGIGAGLAFLLDPQMGRKRRKDAAQRAGRIARRSAEKVEGRARDLGNRAHGVAAEARHALLDRDERVDDGVLVERVRAALGRAVSHPRAIEVTAHDGRVAVSGPVLAAEAEALLAAAAAVRGVTGVEDGLERHETPEGVPALQG